MKKLIIAIAAITIAGGCYAVSPTIKKYVKSQIVAVVVDTNSVPVTTSYTPSEAGQILIGSASNQVWIATGLTTNDWVQLSN